MYYHSPLSLTLSHTRTHTHTQATHGLDASAIEPVNGQSLYTLALNHGWKTALLRSLFPNCVPWLIHTCDMTWLETSIPSLSPLPGRVYAKNYSLCLVDMCDISWLKAMWVAVCVAVYVVVCVAVSVAVCVAVCNTHVYGIVWLEVSVFSLSLLQLCAITHSHVHHLYVQHQVTVSQRWRQA